MFKENKFKILISSAITLLPILFGLIVWNRLPDQIATHWGPDGNPDGFSSKTVAVLLLPLFMLGIHWLCLAFTYFDPKNKEQNRKVFGLIFWLCPIISIFTASFIYMNAFSLDFNVGRICIVLMGLLFIIIGNYLPKCKQNYTIGIKIPWTLESEENWNATHRFAGKVSVIGGVALLPLALLPLDFLPMVLIPVLAIALASMIYSYCYYKKHK